MGPDDPRDSAFDRFGKDARIEARMLQPDVPITGEQRAALLAELADYRETHRTYGCKSMPWEELGARIGVSGSALCEVAQGKYKADDSKILRAIDQFLADETGKQGRHEHRAFVPIQLTHKIKGVIESGLQANKIPVIIGEPGSGKSQHAHWWVGQRRGAVLIEPDDLDCDERWVVDALYENLALSGPHVAKSRRDKKRAIVRFLQSHKNTVIVVDEAQKLTPAALEMLRRLHDLSDPQSQRNVSVVLFGDEHFYKLIVRARGATRAPISPQITRRMFPIFDIATQGGKKDEDGRPIPGTVFSTECIEKTTQNARLKLLQRGGVKYLHRLANVRGYGSIGMAMLVFEAARGFAGDQKIALEDLQLALTTVVGPVIAEEAGEAVEKFFSPLAAAG